MLPILSKIQSDMQSDGSRDSIDMFLDFRSARTLWAESVVSTMSKNDQSVAEDAEILRQGRYNIDNFAQTAGMDPKTVVTWWKMTFPPVDER